MVLASLTKLKVVFFWYGGCYPKRRIVVMSFLTIGYLFILEMKELNYQSEMINVCKNLMLSNLSFPTTYIHDKSY